MINKMINKIKEIMKPKRQPTEFREETPEEIEHEIAMYRAHAILSTPMTGPAAAGQLGGGYEYIPGPFFGLGGEYRKKPPMPEEAQRSYDALVGYSSEYLKSLKEAKK